MKFVVFGLSISSAWGNGHATLWRGLAGALARRGHDLTFFERDVPYYAAHRDLTSIAPHRLVLYDDWTTVQAMVSNELAGADVGMVTSFCPDGPLACRTVLDAGLPVTVFYDLDTPVTLEQLKTGAAVEYLPTGGLSGFDLVLSYTGGCALAELQARLGAKVVAPLYGSVDPEVHRPAPSSDTFRCELSYLGTYSPDRQAAVDRLFVEVARRCPSRRFVMGGSKYPDTFAWTQNLYYVHHVPPADHASFYGSSRATVSVTRGPMAAMGYCPSGRLFEAAACGVPVVSDVWEGLSEFFVPGQEVLAASTTDDVVAALQYTDTELRRIGRAARDRALSCHTADIRAREIETLLEDARAGRPAARQPVT